MNQILTCLVYERMRKRLHFKGHLIPPVCTPMNWKNYNIVGLL